MDIPQELRFKTRNGSDVIINDIKTYGPLPISGLVHVDGKWKKAVWTIAGYANHDEESPLDIDFDQTDIVKIQ